MDEARTLAVTYAFPPFNDTSGIVAAKRLREWGDPFDVIYKDLRGMRPLDGSLTRLVDGLVRRHAQVPGLRTFAGWAGVATFVQAGMDRVLQWEASRGPYENVYSRAHFAASHFLAASLKSSRPGTRWRAEFSDPLSHDVLGGRRELIRVEQGPVMAQLREAVRAQGFREPTVPGVFEWAETVAFALADEILFTNEHQRDFMVAACDDPALAQRVREVSVIAPHPTLPREYYSIRSSAYPLDPERVNIAYFGYLYANRSLEVVLDALRGLDGPDRARLALHVFTPDPGKVTGGLPKKLRDCVSAGAQVEYLEFLALADRMDVLLVNDAETPGGRPSPFLPSKWSDYRGSRAAVWGIVEEGSILSRQDLHHRSPVGSVTAAEQVLVRLARSGQADRDEVPFRH